MHGQNSKENQDKQVEYYNEYVGRQKNISVNLRHKSIASKLVSAGLKSTSNVLEIGCGIGTFSGLLADLIPNGKGLCVDISDKSIEEASNCYNLKTNLTFKTANAIEHNFGDQSFDAVVLPDVIEHIPLEFHSKLFEKISQLLKPQGFVFIHIPNPHYLAWCHENRPDLLQIIDQPIYTDELITNTSPYGLNIHSLNTYSIWVEDGDYQYIILKKANYQNFENQIEEKITIWDKIKYKMNASKG